MVTGEAEDAQPTTSTAEHLHLPLRVMGISTKGTPRVVIL
jgi:hypothetical protein